MNSMRDLEWKEILAVIAPDVEGSAGEGQRPEIDDAWREITRRLMALAAIVRRSRPALTAEDGEDIVQNVLMRMREPRMFAAVAGSQSCYAYLARVIHNAAVDALRRDARHVPLEEDQRVVELSSDRVDAAALLASVSPEERELLRMLFWEELTMAEIALRLGQPYSTIAKRCFRMMERIRKRASRVTGVS